MFMLPLRCVTGSSSELTLACSNLDRNLHEGSSLGALESSLRCSRLKSGYFSISTKGHIHSPHCAEKMEGTPLNTDMATSKALVLFMDRDTTGTNQISAGASDPLAPPLGLWDVASSLCLYPHVSCPPVALPVYACVLGSWAWRSTQPPGCLIANLSPHLPFIPSSASQYVCSGSSPALRHTVV
ncbi:unnamed protein product, partial [Pleuronectes platessa]